MVKHIYCSFSGLMRPSVRILLQFQEFTGFKSNLIHSSHDILFSHYANFFGESAELIFLKTHPPPTSTCPQLFLDPPPWMSSFLDVPYYQLQRLASKFRCLVILAKAFKIELNPAKKSADFVCRGTENV